MTHFLAGFLSMHVFLAAAGAYLFGVFTPRFGRFVKSFFVKEAGVVGSKIAGDAQALRKRF